MNLEIVKREVYGEIDAKYGRTGKKPWVVPKHPRHPQPTPWKKEDSEEKKKLKD